MTAPKTSTLHGLDAILEAFAKAEVEHADLIEAVDARHRSAAVNLVHFTTLRQRDVRALQTELTSLGVTSLAATGADVKAMVSAARRAVAALSGHAPGEERDAFLSAFAQGEERLAVNARAVLGPTRAGRPTRIMVTLPSEAADDPGLVARLVEAGMDIARVNCAHDDRDVWGRMAQNVRTAAQAAGRSVLVSMDLPGPKLRTGPIADGPAVSRARVRRAESGRIVAPASIWLTSGPIAAQGPVAAGARARLPITVDQAWLADRSAGDRIDLVDARQRRRLLTVIRAEADGVLAVCDQNVYLTNGSRLQCGGRSTTVRGVPPLPGRLSLSEGDALVLTRDLAPVEPPGPGQVARIGCTLPEAVAALRPGDAVLFDDGTITATVESVRDGEADLRVLRTKPGGQHLGAEKGINLPDTVLPLDALTPADEQQLSFISDHADMVAVSFIRTRHDVLHVLDRLRASAADGLGLVLKIETREGFENLPAILLTAMRHDRLAVMVARGDLAVEIGFERLAEVPRQILALCEAAHVPSIWATQVLEGLAKNGIPSRAEITDAAAGQRADCVMLNKGPYIVQAIEVLDVLVRQRGQQERRDDDDGHEPWRTGG